MVPGISQYIKEYYLQDSKNVSIEIDFLTGARAGQNLAINSGIELNSMSITESICSGDTIKFGLCEDNYFSVNVESDEVIPVNSMIKVTGIHLYTKDGRTYSHKMPLGIYVIKSVNKILNSKLKQVEAYSFNINNQKKLPDFERWFYGNGYVLNKSTAGGNNIIPYSSLIWQHITPDIDLDWTNETPTIRTYESYFYDETVKRNLLVRVYYALAQNYEVESYNYHYCVKKHRYYAQNAKRYAEIVSKATTDFSANLGKPVPSVEARFLGKDAGHLSNDYYYASDYDKVISLQHKYTRNSSDYSVLCLAYFPLYAIVYDGTAATETLNLSADNKIYKKQDGGTSEYAFSIELDQRRVFRDGSAKITGYSASDEVLDAYDAGSFINAVLELKGKFGRVDRDGFFKEVTLTEPSDYGHKFPSYQLYPSSNIYPSIWTSNYMPIGTSMHSGAIIADEPCHKFGYVRVTYLATDNENYSITVECDPQYDNVYDMRENYIFLNSIWTADEVKAKIKNEFYPLIKDIEYTPVSYSGLGIPYLEPGDPITVYGLDGKPAKTYIFSRILTGEQNYTDDVETNGTARNEDADLWINLKGDIERG